MDPVIRAAIARIDILRDGRVMGRGTGFLAARGLVLTALHVVADRSQDPPALYSDEMMLHFPGHATKAVLLDACFDRSADWALLQCLDPPPARPIPLAGAPPSGVDWEAFGFPDANPRDGMVQVGILENSHGALDGERVFQLYSREAAAGNGAPVKGLSGSPVMVKNAAVGILRFALMRNEMTVAGTLYACPIESILDRCAGALPTVLLMIGKRLGSYEIIREIGRGLTGTVYLAGRADDQFNKKVALKIIESNVQDRETLGRFRRERQILAALSHPNIATLLDGGLTPSNEPYLVTEFVEGVPLDRYCDSHTLPILERITLFRKLCSAVQYAHQNLIIHRDLKPNSVLVTADGVPKLITFGIAKILQVDLAGALGDVTRGATPVLTPRYASPEQLRCETLTTATDVYSLGAILHELLTGVPPSISDVDPLQALAQAVSEKEPEAPSQVVTNAMSNDLHRLEEVSRNRACRPEQLRSSLDGDLDEILLKALHREPQRRYASVEQFSEDLRRYVESLPVSANEGKLGPRVVKFVHRNRRAVVAGAITLILLVASTIAASIAARNARLERAKAERRFQDVEQLATAVLFNVDDSIQNLAGSAPARALIAEAYMKIGDIQGDPPGKNLGETQKAIQSYRKGLALSEELVSQHPQDLEFQATLARAHLRLGRVLPSEEHAEAVRHLDLAVDSYEQILRLRPESSEAGLDLAAALEAKGDILGGSRDAMMTYRNALSKLPADPPAASHAARLRTVLIKKIASLEKRPN